MGWISTVVASGISFFCLMLHRFHDVEVLPNLWHEQTVHNCASSLSCNLCRQRSLRARPLKAENAPHKKKCKAFLKLEPQNVNTIFVYVNICTMHPCTCTLFRTDPLETFAPRVWMHSITKITAWALQVTCFSIARFPSPSVIHAVGTLVVNRSTLLV